MKNQVQLKIYYLDDELELCEMFSDIFASEKIEVTCFSNPKSAIDAITNSPPDLFFVDYRLPSTNGDLVAQKLDPAIPKFLITGDINITTTYNFEKIFGKPYKEQDIRNVIEPYLEKLCK